MAFQVLAQICSQAVQSIPLLRRHFSLIASAVAIFLQFPFFVKAPVGQASMQGKPSQNRQNEVPTLRQGVPRSNSFA
jgi:hypothetical protein